MLLQFTKMHGLGNDFVVIDLVTQRAHLDENKIRHIADRRLGIGCDQVLIVEPPTNPDVDFRYRIYNCDGQEVEQCGNGARCFAKFVLERKLIARKEMTVETQSGVITLNVEKYGNVRVDMGTPHLNPIDVPFISTGFQNTYDIEVNNTVIPISAISMGNPHGVLIVDSALDAPVDTLGPALECHKAFPNKANIGFMEIVSTNEINLRVFERGVGETKACGSGACAAVVAGILQGRLDSEVTVNLQGGSLTIEWQGKGSSVIMTGAAASVFQGKIQI